MGLLWRTLICLTFIQACIKISVSEKQEKHHNPHNSLYHEKHFRVRRDTYEQYLNRIKSGQKETDYSMLSKDELQKKYMNEYFGMEKIPQIYRTLLTVNIPMYPSHQRVFYRLLEARMYEYIKHILGNRYREDCTKIETTVRSAKRNTNEPNNKVDVIFQLKIPIDCFEIKSFESELHEHIKDLNEGVQIGPNYYYRLSNDINAPIDFNDSVPTTTTPASVKILQKSNLVTRGPNGVNSNPQNSSVSV